MPDAAPPPPPDESALALHAEVATVSRRLVAGDTVRVATVTRAIEQVVDEALSHERVEIERVAINRAIDAVPDVRQEGDTTILSVVEEVLVVERRLILQEEVRVRRVRGTERHQETVVLRKQDAVVTRVEAVPGASGSAADVGSPVGALDAINTQHED